MTARKRILIADDEPHILRALGFVLEREGYALQYAVDGEEALVMARQERPDLVILDVMMPRLDGFKACRALRREPGLASTQVIFLTAKGQESDHQQALAAGADRYLTKPFSPSEVVDVVRQLLSAGG